MNMKKLIYISLLLTLSVCTFKAAATEGVVSGLPGRSVKEAVALDVEGLAVSAGGRLWLSLDGQFMDGKAILLCQADGGRWMDSSTIVPSAEHGVLWLDPMGALKLFFTVDNTLYCTMCMDPDAASPAWSAPVKLGEGYASGVPVFVGRMLMLPVMIPGEGPGVYVSRNNGITWTYNAGPRNTPEYQKAADNNPELFVSGAGEVSMVIRSLGTAKAYRSTSSDYGVTWSKPLEFIYNPATDLSVCSLGGGRTAVVKNCRYDNKVTHMTKGLYVYITQDNGDLWYGGLQVDAREGVSDPVMTISGGRIYVAYKYVDKGRNDILLASMTENEVNKAWGTLDTAPSEKSVVFSAGRSQENFDNTLKSLSKGTPKWGEKTLRIATYNIIFHGYVKNPTWEQRLVVLEKMFRQYEFDVVGTQEPDSMQVRTLIETLGGDYGWVGTIRENPVVPGTVLAINPIFYRKDRVEVLDHGVFYYGDAVGVQGYDASGFGRNCNWAKFRDKANDMVFFVFNSHYDHRGLEAKEYSSVTLLENAARISKGLPTVFTGDFNLDEKNPGYAKMVNSGWTDDAMLALPEKKRENWEYFSMASFKPVSKISKSYRHIDHIFYTPFSSKVLTWKLILDSYDGIYGSDHLPIVIDWKISN